MRILKTLFGAETSRRKQTQTFLCNLGEELERRDLLSAVALLPDDIIMTRRYFPPGEETSNVASFLAYRPSTHETIPLVVPRLNDPNQINDQLYILTFQFEWQTNNDTTHAHVIFGGSVVPTAGTELAGVFDFDITAGTLTAMKAESEFGGDPDYGDLTIAADGTIVVTRHTFRGFSPSPLVTFSVMTLDGSTMWFHQDIYFGGGGYQSGIPTNSLAFDDSRRLYAAFYQDDGFFSSSENTDTHGNTPHQPGIYRLDPNHPDTREPIFNVAYGQIDMQFAADGSIIALIGDVGAGVYSRRDVAAERVVRIDPATKAVTTLFSGNKRFDYHGLLLDSMGHVILSASDNSHDGNTNIFELGTTGKKKPKTTANLLFADQPDGNGSYGVVPPGDIAVVKPQPTAVNAASPRSPAKTTSPHYHRGKSHRGRG